VLAGFALLPLLGIHRSIALLSLANLAGAAWGLGARRLRDAAPLALAAALAAFLLASEPARFAAEGQQPSSKVLYYDEGVGATVSVLHMRGRPDDRVVSVDGVVIGATAGDIHQKQQELAHLPFLLAPGLERGLTVGLGSGILLAEMARHPELRKVTCVEILPGVVEGAALFAEHTGDVLASPKVELVVDDGVRYLRHAPELYDVIVSDAKSQPQHAGNSAFLSRDFYESALAHLRPGGLFVQWVPLHVPPPDYRIALRTFLEAFPVTWVWISPPHASFFIGAREPLRLDRERIDAALREPAFRGMRRLGWRDGAGVLAFLSADGPSLAPLLGAGPLNTLERPLLEFYGLRDYDVPGRVRQAQNRALLLRARAALAGSPEAGSSWRAASALLEVDWYGGGPASQGRLEEALRLAPESPTLRHLAARALQGRALALIEAPGQAASDLTARAREAEALLREARRVAPGDFELRLALGEAAAEQVGQDALRSLEGVVRGGDGWVELPLLLSGDLLGKGRPADAVAFLRQALAADPANVDAQSSLGFLLVTSPPRARLGDPASGRRILEQAWRAEPDNYSVLNNYAIAVFLAGDPQRARALIDRAVEIAPQIPGLRRTQRQIYEAAP
jgi:spermidine synthase